MLAQVRNQPLLLPRSRGGLGAADGAWGAWPGLGYLTDEELAALALFLQV